MSQSIVLAKVYKVPIAYVVTVLCYESLNEFLGLKEALEMSHLPDAHQDEDDGLSQGPPQHLGIGAVTHQTEPLLTNMREGGRGED